ncbi:hypothetical protein A6J71_10525 [Enterobacter cancerogenus]|uniref:hypothetical protein n=1 Tax=Enterobacter cancerogenus TaxID=69218 RepID=UPI000C9B334F|nr:hypothetical protein [Enterobacter cancerogenus]PNF10559.1 hypothetical protein A6J71_10525 [Enterobacter cancerogenus]
MLTETIGALGVIKLFFQLVKDNDKKYDPAAFIESLPEAGIGAITIHGRGGLEVSSQEIKQSPEFAAMQNYAVERIRHDSAEEVNVPGEQPIEVQKMAEGDIAR